MPRADADEVAEKVTGRPRGEVPLAATRVTAFIDVHDKTASKMLLRGLVGRGERDFVAQRFQAFDQMRR